MNWRTLAAVLRQKLSALSLRERAGLALFSAMLAVVAVFLSADWSFTARERANSARAERRQGEAASARQASPAWREEIALAAGKVWEWSLVETTESIARARAMSDLETLVMAAGIGEPTVDTADAPESGPARGVRAMDFTITGNFDWPSFLALLEALENAAASFAPVAVEVNALEDAARFTLTVRAAFLDEDAGA